MCVHVQVTECSRACHGHTSAPCHGSYTAVQELLRCSSLSVCEELETESQSNLPKCPRPVPTAMRGDARLASSQAKHLLQGRGNVDAWGVRQGRCWKQLFLGVAASLPPF